MRKITIKAKPKKLIFMIFKGFIGFVQEAHMLEIIKLDFKKRIEITIIKFIMKEGYTIEDIKLPRYMEIMNIFEQKDNEYTCMLKAEYPPVFSKITKLFDIDIIWVQPNIFSEKEIVMSCIANEKNLERFKKALGIIGKIKSVSYKKDTYFGYNSLSLLTEKQKQIFRIAKKEGYYKYPRKIDGNKLAKKIGVTKATLIEHLRKIENKIMDEIDE